MPRSTTVALGAPAPPPPCDHAAPSAYDVERPPLPLRAGPTQVDDPLLGQRIDHFEVRGILGQGGMGTVYLAHDLSLERPVAIKVLRPELAGKARLIDRLVMEARAQARLQHPNVVTIYHIGSYRGAPYFAMEYVPGRTLADHLEARGPLPWPEALEYIIQACRALMAAHARGIVHRDIKPSNLMLDGTPGPANVGAAIKVADFGLAALPGATQETFVGSPSYAAPEQIAGCPPSYRGDVYALGITFHELLTGAPPFQADSLRHMMSLHLHAPRPPIPDLRCPWRLRRLITEMLDPDPPRRPSYESLLDQLKSLRPRSWVAGGVAARATALAVDLAVVVSPLAAAGQLLRLPRLLTSAACLLAFAAYYVLCHRRWGKTLGKRLLGLRLQGTTRAISAPRLALRFVVAFWGPLLAALLLGLPPGLLADELGPVKMVSHLGVWPGGGGVWLPGLAPTGLMLVLPWLTGFLFPVFNDQRQTLHDRAARTRVIYELGPDDLAVSPRAARA